MANVREISIQNIAVEVEKKEIKHFHLSVYPPNGRVHISVPVGTSDERVREYVLQKWVWLADKIRKATSHRYQLPREYVSGEEHFSRGQSYRLKVEPIDQGAPGVFVRGDYLVLSVRRGSTIAKRAQVLNAWYRDDLKSILAPLIGKWEKILSVRVSKWDVKRMETRWGSCNHSKATLLFNLELAKRNQHCVEYIVAHEMIHILERTHTDRFRHILFSHLPDWESYRKELNEFPLTGGLADDN